MAVWMPKSHRMRDRRSLWVALGFVPLLLWMLAMAAPLITALCVQACKKTEMRSLNGAAIELMGPSQALKVHSLSS